MDQNPQNPTGPVLTPVDDGGSVVQPPAATTDPAPVDPNPTTPPAALANENSSPDKKMMYVLFGVVALMIVLGAGVVFMMIKKGVPSYNPTSTTAPTYTAAPSATPISTSNVDQTLGNTDNSVQQSIDQANTDLNQVSNVNSAQDTNTGL